MNYKFPHIENISDVLPAIEGRDEFTVAVKEGYTVINYNVMMAGTFGVAELHQWNKASRPPENWKDYFTLDRDSALRRECRGIIFDTETGEIIRRPFHKFFNVNEREETQDHRINLSQDHAILEKLDGSMIAPFIVNGQMIWGTKMGATDVAKPVEEFVKNNAQYVSFANWMLSMSLTPIFEWCSRKQRIVLDYSEDQLILTAVRHMYDGHYVNRESMIGFAEDGGDIPVVRAFEPQTDMREFIKYVSTLEDLEGFVVRFDDGHKIKLKCDWYVQIHKAKEAILQDRNIIEIILDEKLDDVKAHLPAEDRDRLTQFENDFNQKITSLISKIYIEVDEVQYRYGPDRKSYALGRAQDTCGFVRPIIFAMWDEDATLVKIADRVHKTIRNNLSKTVKYEAIRDAWFPGVIYNN